MVTLVERERSDEFRLMPPPPSAEIEKTYQRYESLGGIEVEKMRQQALEVVKVMFDFADYKDPNVDEGNKKGLISSTYEAAYLLPIMKMLTSTNPIEKDAAEQALKAYHSKHSRDPEYIQDRKYVRAISRDIVEIDTFLATQFDERELVGAEGTEPDSAVRQYQNPYNKQYKKKPFEDALELIADEPEEGVENPKGVNLESVVISAALAYYNLRHSDDLDFPEDTVVQTIYAAETFYEPALDIISYGAFGSMAFKREVSLIRLSRNGGKYGNLDNEKLAVARDMLSQLPPPEKMPSVIANLLSQLTSKHAEAESVLRDTSGHGVQFITGSIYDRISEDGDPEDEAGYDTDDNVIGIRSRVQTDVKAASKITIKRETDKSGKETVKIKHGADLVGALLIFKSVDLLLHTYEQVVGMANDFDSLSSKVVPKKSRSKNSPMHLAGEGLIKLAEKELGGILGEYDTTIKQNGYQAAKITLQYTPPGTDFPIPFEIAFQTVDDRFEARVGKASHAFQDDDRNYDVTPPRLRVNKGLHVRRGRLSEPGLTTTSEQRAEEFYEGKSKRRRGGAGIRAFLRSDDGGNFPPKSRIS